MKTGFKKAELMIKDIRKELVTPEVLPDNTWYERLSNEKQTGYWETNIEREYREAEEKFDKDNFLAQQQESEKLNNSPLVFVRAKGYMSLANTRRNMYFYSSTNEKLSVVQAFPVRENMLEKINKSFKKDNITFEVMNANEYKYVYSLLWGEVNRYVAHEITTDTPFPYALMQEEPPELLAYKLDHHSRWYWKSRLNFWGEDEGEEYLSFDIDYQVVFSNDLISYIKDE